MTPRGTHMGAVAHNRTPVKSERTALVCWGPKGKNERKRGLIQRQPGRRVPNDTHTLEMKLIQSFNIPGPQSPATRFHRDGVTDFPRSSRCRDGRDSATTRFLLRWRRGNGWDSAAKKFPSRWWRCDGCRQHLSLALPSPRAGGKATAGTVRQRTSPRASGVVTAGGDAFSSR